MTGALKHVTRTDSGASSSPRHEHRGTRPSQDCIFELDDDSVLFDLSPLHSVGHAWARSPLGTRDEEGALSDATTPSPLDGASCRHASYSQRQPSQHPVAGGLQRRAFPMSGGPSPIPSPVISVRRAPPSSPSHVQRFFSERNDPLDSLLGLRNGYRGC